MSADLDAPVVQPASFAFTPENRAKALGYIAKYPPGRQASAVLPLLYLAQAQLGWVPQKAMEHIAEMLEMPPIRVHEVASFYTMFNLRPVGKHLVQLCTTTPCWLRGSEAVVGACKKHLGVDLDQTTADGQFTLKEVECLGACVNAPMVQINDDFYEDLDAESMIKILDALKRGEKPKTHSQKGRTSHPQSGATTLKDVAR
ncbi:MAG: NADH-quinone oxidoreductase subunit NuoE [Alphaproteobacteria bacterium]|nr:NADH-quinone oxidoreductase subunit NuoE [Alphaproteobacteria bacterium]